MTQFGMPLFSGNPNDSQPMPEGSGALPPAAYTPWATRVAAAMIDWLPAAALIGFGAVVLMLTTDMNCQGVEGDSPYGDPGFGEYCASSTSTLGTTLYLMFVVLASVYGIWNQCYRQGRTGSSIGKSAMKFKVIGEKTGQPIGFGMSFLRQLAHFADTVTCYIGYLFPLWDPKRQTFADKIMSTVCLPIGWAPYGLATPAQPQPGYQWPQQTAPPQPPFPPRSFPQQQEPYQPGDGSDKPYRPSY